MNTTQNRLPKKILVQNAVLPDIAAGKNGKYKRGNRLAYSLHYDTLFGGEESTLFVKN